MTTETAETTSTTEIPGRHTRVVTLTDRPPVRIADADWPLVAQAHDADDRVHPHQATRTWSIRVRRHADGRALVYGVHDTQWQGERGRRAGELLDARGAGDPEQLVAAIRRVAEGIGRASLAAECVAALPPEEL